MIRFIPLVAASQEFVFSKSGDKPEDFSLSEVIKEQIWVLPEYFEDIFVVEVVEVDPVVLGLEQVNQVSLHLALLYYLPEYSLKKPFEELLRRARYFNLLLNDFGYYNSEARTDLSRSQVDEQVV